MCVTTVLNTILLCLSVPGLLYGCRIPLARLNVQFQLFARSSIYKSLFFVGYNCSAFSTGEYKNANCGTTVLSHGPMKNSDWVRLGLITFEADSTNFLFWRIKNLYLSSFIFLHDLFIPVAELPTFLMLSFHHFEQPKRERS